MTETETESVSAYTYDTRTICETCGHEILIGQFPFCPHRPGVHASHQDDIPGGLTVHNYGPAPMTFWSHQERRAYMKRHGLTEIEKFCPAPGTDKDPQGIPNPAGYMDAQTMENARILLGRSSEPKENWDAQQAGVIKLIENDYAESGADIVRILGEEEASRAR